MNIPRPFEAGRSSEADDTSGGDPTDSPAKPGSPNLVHIGEQPSKVSGSDSTVASPDSDDHVAEVVKSLAGTLYNSGAIDAVVGVAVFMTTPVDGPVGVVGALELFARAGAAASGATNLMVHLAGGDDTFEKNAGVFNPVGLAAFTTAEILGTEPEHAAEYAKWAGAMFDVVSGMAGLPEVPSAQLPAAAFSLKKALTESGILSGHADRTYLDRIETTQKTNHPQCSIRPPGGPFKVLP